MRQGGDPRLTPARPDLAAAYLEGVVEADRFVTPVPMQVSASVLPIRRTPEPDGPQETQALFGEVFDVLEERDGWGWGQAQLDGYVGYVDMGGLSAPVLTATHRVTVLRTYRFSAPDLKSAPYPPVSLNAQVTIEELRGQWGREARGGWLWMPHLAPCGEGYADDPAQIALMFQDAPYFWGGRESLGLDCSGLIQNAWQGCGAVPLRDADQQEEWFAAPERGEVIHQHREGADPLRWTDHKLRRNDLIFWPGHVALMVDDRLMIHANATRMAVSIDPLQEMAEAWRSERPEMILRRIIRPTLPSEA